MKIKAIVAVILAAVAVSALVRLHFIREEGGGGYILWKDGDAYLFLWDRPFGYSISLFNYLLEPVWEYFYAPSVPDNEKWHLAIIRISQSGVERHDQEFAVDVTYFTPVGDEIYAHCPGGVCKWTGTLFQLLSDQEVQTIGGEDQLSKGEFTGVKGWSKRLVRATGAGDAPQSYEFSLDLSSGDKVIVRGSNPTSVSVLRPDHNTEQVWYHEQRTRRVTAAEYKDVFRKR
jgi:hypothetical protein